VAAKRRNRGKTEAALVARGRPIDRATPLPERRASS
jgi:hypothetical protein